ncbi:MAG: transposase [Mycoplasmatales bacterium]
MKLYSVIVPDRKPRTVAKAIQDIIISNNLQIDSITSDNGMEFTLFKHFIRVVINWYFADPFTSGQRGQKERLNRDIRMFFLKGCNFNKYDDSQLKLLLINNLPRRKFNGLSAIEKPVMI